MFCDGMMKNVLLHQRNVVRVEWDQFHHQVGGVMESSAMESFMHQVSYHVFVFLTNFNMDCFDKLVFGLGEGVSRASRGVGREVRGLGVLGAITDVLPLEANPGQCWGHWGADAAGALPGSW